MARSVTTAYIEERLREAIHTLRLLPDPDRRHLRSLRSVWPAMAHDAVDQWSYELSQHEQIAAGTQDSVESAHARHGGPDPAAISRMDQALPWLRWLTIRYQRVVWDRLSGQPLWRIAARHHRSERTIERWYKEALEHIADEVETHGRG